VTQKAGVAGSGWSTSAAWIGLNGDGRLDLVVARYIQWDWDDVWCGEHREGYRSYCHPNYFKPISMLAYHNDGNGVFSEEAHNRGLDKPAKTLGLAIADYDHGRTCSWPTTPWKSSWSSISRLESMRKWVWIAVLL
jgi:hypothetical protein